jgi:hypothetical protein
MIKLRRRRVLCKHDGSTIVSGAWFDSDNPRPLDSIGSPLALVCVGTGTIKGHGALNGTAMEYVGQNGMVLVPIGRHSGKYRKISNS